MSQPATLADLRERKRRVVRDEIRAAALRQLIERGFDATTVDDIAAVVGVSRRTFFRYFASKEDVVVGYLDEFGQRLREHVKRRQPDEPPLVAVRNALESVIEVYAADRAHTLAIARLCADTPALRARYLDKQDRWLSGIAVELSRRSGLDPDRDMLPRLVAGIAMSAFDVAFGAWVAGGGSGDLSGLVDQAFMTLDTALG